MTESGMRSSETWSMLDRQTWHPLTSSSLAVFFYKFWKIFLSLEIYRTAGDRVAVVPCLFYLAQPNGLHSYVVCVITLKACSTTLVDICYECSSFQNRFAWYLYWWSERAACHRPIRLRYNHKNTHYFCSHEFLNIWWWYGTSISSGNIAEYSRRLLLNQLHNPNLTFICTAPS